MDEIPILSGLIRLVSLLFRVSEVEAALIVGVMLALLIGWLAFKFGAWNKARGTAYVPMQAFTSKTAYQVVGESRSASMKMLLTMILILLACAGFYLYVYQPEEAQTVIQAIGDLLHSFTSP